MDNMSILSGDLDLSMENISLSVGESDKKYINKVDAGIGMFGPGPCPCGPCPCGL
ncbi:hypothetical protein [Celerinatantimonas yamalensis]|uniref:Bacteriocin-like protein n=1 Tax=Celerinatantimonas yamalensis TaxID=559956 RepID=A0ABW9GCI9_9GAMM